MATPDKNQSTPTSLSKFEDSPVFRYISSLSPIEPVKSTQSGHVFNSLALVSPSSLFPSPQISYHRESRFAIRRQKLSESPNSELAERRNESSTSERASETAKQSDACDEQQRRLNNGHTSTELTSETIDDHLDVAIELPKTLKYDCGSPENNLVTCNEISEVSGMEDVEKPGSPTCHDKNEEEETQHAFENAIDLRKICGVKQIEEQTECDWVKMVSDVADLLTYNSAISYENTDGQDQKMVDPGTVSFMSSVLQYPQENIENVDSGGPHEFCGQQEAGEAVKGHPVPILSAKLLDNNAEMDDNGENFSNATCEQRSIRRRCLVFEMASAQKKRQVRDLDCSSSIPSGSDYKAPGAGKFLVSTKGGCNFSSSMSSGIGLHLNSLAVSSESGQNSHSKSLVPASMETDMIPIENEAMVLENSQEMSEGVGGNDADHSSPGKKRHKFEGVGENVSCKRCNCKRSKCLKLYCECFAAGLYCIEPCSCRDCFNQPIHENIVLETRRQIESRNPLAFAPKVIRSTDSISELGGETNKTPASARHKRGCNCKKSSCLKKYCECFQGAVGCSPSCRCEGCKNTFGRKDGFDEVASETEDVQSSEKNALEKVSCDDVLVKGKEEHSDRSIASSEIVRVPACRPFAYYGKLPGSLPHATSPALQLCTASKAGTSKFSSCQSKFDSHLQAIPEDKTLGTLKTNRSSPSHLNSTSPNRKRVLPPHQDLSSSTGWNSRRLILRSIPRFPSLSPPKKL